jgi:hypothetical protein
MSKWDITDTLMVRETLRVLDGALKANAELSKTASGGVVITITINPEAIDEVRAMSLDKFGSVVIEPLLASAANR